MRVKPSLRFSQKPVSAWRQPKFLKGVGRDGNYYRLTIPPRRKPLPRIPKLFPKGSQQRPPKPLTPPPPPPESAAEILTYKRRLFKWLLGNIPVLILNFGRYAILVSSEKIMDGDETKQQSNFFFFSFALMQFVHVTRFHQIRYFGTPFPFRDRKYLFHYLFVEPKDCSLAKHILVHVVWIGQQLEDLSNFRRTKCFCFHDKRPGKDLCRFLHATWCDTQAIRTNQQECQSLGTQKGGTLDSKRRKAP